MRSSPASCRLDSTIEYYLLAYISQLLSRRVIECVSSLAYLNLISCSPGPTSRSSLPALTLPAMSGLCTLIWIPHFTILIIQFLAVTPAHFVKEQDSHTCFRLYKPHGHDLRLVGLVLISLILCLISVVLWCKRQFSFFSSASSLLDSGCNGSAILHDVRHYASFTICSIICRLIPLHPVNLSTSSGDPRIGLLLVRVLLQPCSRTPATHECSPPVSCLTRHHCDMLRAEVVDFMSSVLSWVCRFHFSAHLRCATCASCVHRESCSPLAERCQSQSMGTEHRICFCLWTLLIHMSLCLSCTAAR